MKRFTKISLTALAAAAMLSSCNTKSSEQQQAEEFQAQATRDELAAALAERDQLISLVNEINQGMEQIKQLENILTVSNSNPDETISNRETIQNDIAAIQKALQDRRAKLDELEKKISASNQANANLRKTIASLRSQIESQTQEIEALNADLSAAYARISALDATVETLNTTVNEVTGERDLAQEENAALAKELNTCYYAIGSKSELKERNIIETGFLRKTKLMKGDFDQNFFTTADKRTLSRIALHSKKAQVLTNQPEGSYLIIDDNGQKVLVITNPDSFWSLSNYLVVKID